MKPVLIGLYSSDMRSGKSTVASMLTERLFGTTQSFATPLREFVIEVAQPFMPEGETVQSWLMDEDFKDFRFVPELGVTLRSMMQTLGTTWGRDSVHRDLWMKLAEKKAQRALKSYSVIFDDMRFPNEFEMVKRNGGKCVRIHRPGIGSRGDTSIGEGLLDRHEFDFHVTNIGTLQDLREKVWFAATRLETLN